RYRHGDHAAVGRPGESRRPRRQGRAVDVRNGSIDAQSREARTSLNFAGYRSLESLMTTSTFRNYIAGDWVAGATAIANRNPSDVHDIIGEYAQADAAQARAAIAAAKDTFPAWSTGSIQERANILDRAGTE